MGLSSIIYTFFTNFIIHSWNTVSDFSSDLFGLVKVFIDFIYNFLTNITSYFESLALFIRTYIVELPITLVTMFGELPIFVQTGLIVLLYAIYISFIFRIIKLIVPFLQEVFLWLILLYIYMIWLLV